MAEFIAKYWIEFLFGLISSGSLAGFNYLRLQNKKRKTEQCAIKNGLQALLRNSIIEQYNKWMDREYIPIYAMENVTAMYKEYKALGGNGTVKQLYEELLELPHRKEDVK